MKKKLIPLIVAIVCSLFCACGLIACGGDDGAGGGKTLQSIVVVDNSGEHSGTYDLGVITSLDSLSSLKVYAKYSDGTKTDITSEVSLSYTHNGNAIPSLTGNFDDGSYKITASYQGKYVYVTFTVGGQASNSPYSLTLSKTEWRYQAEAPTPTVTENGTPLAENEYIIYYITAAKYNEIKDASDFDDKLINEREWFTSTEYLKPGSYYFFASVYSDNSNFVQVTVQKAKLNVSFDGEPAITLANTYWPSGTLGTMKISNIDLMCNNMTVLSAETGEPVSGYLIWQNPDEQITCAANGQTRKVACRASEDDAYDDYVLPNDIEIELDRSVLSRKWLYETEHTFDATAHDIMLGNISPGSGDIDLWNNIITITKSYNGGTGETVTLDENAGLGTAREVGVYTFKIAFKDKVNYVWSWDDDQNQNQTSSDDYTLTYTVKGMASSANFNRTNKTFSVDADLKVRLEMNADSNYDNDESLTSTPYAAGTLVVTSLGGYGANSKDMTQVSATVTVVNEGGKDYVEIQITDLKQGISISLGDFTLYLQVTAVGDQNFDDIDRETSVNITLAPEIPADMGKKLVGTKVSTLYTQYPSLVTKFGTWKLQAKINGVYVDVDVEQGALQEGKNELKLVFVAADEYKDRFTITKVIEFIITGVNSL
ncbi:MAG: hypothetical protein J1F69_01730 [Clostridiales bacterium]|nr:hypothetical protein [Clostridiales bacterium]